MASKQILEHRVQANPQKLDKWISSAKARGQENDFKSWLGRNTVVVQKWKDLETKGYHYLSEGLKAHPKGPL